MVIRGKLRAVELVALALAGMAVVLAAPAQAGFPGRNGRIVYDTSNAVAGKYGFDARNIVSFQLGKRPHDQRGFQACLGGGWAGQYRDISCVGAGDPAYAPDGRRLAFVQRGYVTSRDPTWQYEPLGPLAIANDDGSSLGSRQLTEADAEPAWSPRGRSIVFKGRSGANYDLYVVGADLNGLRCLTFDPAVESDPAWTAARGGWIAFSREGDLFRMRPDGMGLRHLTRGGGTEPAWSPDGSRIAFTRKGDVHVCGPTAARCAD
jgi:TolB protein